MYEVTHLFEARTGGYRTYRVPGILATMAGTVIATAEARTGKGGDWDANDIIARRSPDSGKTWLESKVILRHQDYGPGPISNFVMIADGSRVHGLFCHNYARIFSLYSDDQGATWSERREITSFAEPFKESYPWRVIATGPGHAIKTATGRFVVPVWMSTGEGGEFGKGKLGHRPSAVSVFYSDDRGDTWNTGEFVVRHDPEGMVNPSETLAVELSDGRVLFNIRSESKKNRRAISISADGAVGWSPFTYDEALLEPVCMASLIRLTQKAPDGRPIILFANPANLENKMIPAGGNLAHDRKRLTVFLSEDDCASWPVSRVLEPGPSGYSDMAQTPDGSIFCIHEDQNIDRMCDDRYVTVRRFDLDWVRGKD